MPVPVTNAGCVLVLRGLVALTVIEFDPGDVASLYVVVVIVRLNVVAFGAAAASAYGGVHEIDDAPAAMVPIGPVSVPAEYVSLSTYDESPLVTVMVIGVPSVAFGAEIADVFASHIA